MYSYGEGPEDRLSSPVAFGFLNLQIPWGVGLECGGRRHPEGAPSSMANATERQTAGEPFGWQGRELVARVEEEQ